MELVVARIDELRLRLTEHFELWARGADGTDKPKGLSPQEGLSPRLSCALSGGATALIFLGALRNANVDWRRITLFWADERAVPPDDPESNFGIADRLLLGPLGAKAPRALRMPADMPHLGAAALHYDNLLAHELHNGPLDLALLGVGEDGHICSLFPGHRALIDDDLRVVAVEDAPKPPRRRLSLTLPYLRQTKKIWLIAVGPRKLPVLHAAMERTRMVTPLDLLMQQAKDVTVYTDQVIHRA
ncbi:MAG: 6-phosphogluconolactonase [Acidobacteria bacterium RIFCSPLOWO2_12_FULL_67_14b]|nr:MAG: 6-phosphogluconolactonase [Acidobacteria bacterium RIFCSPLOWO2_12_FULL_67_14b]